MAKYIDKSAIVAEIEKIREHIKRLHYAVDANCIVTVRNACECLDSSIDLFVNSLDTIEVKEVDLKNAEQFIQDCTRKCSNELCSVEDRYGKTVISYHEWLTPDQARKVVEIAKEEAIEKACEWLKSYRQDTPDGTGYIAGIVNDKTIEDFRNSMKGE